MEKEEGDLPLFCKLWCHRHVILVWGAGAFNHLTNHKSNLLLKSTKHTTIHPLAFPWNCGYGLVCFDGPEFCKTSVDAGTLQSFGGYPVLVIDISKFNLSDIGQLQRPGRVVYGLSLPVWFHFVVTVSMETVALYNHVSNLDHLISGCSRILDKRDYVKAVVEYICQPVDSLTKEVVHRVCRSCFSSSFVSEDKDDDVGYVDSHCGHFKCNLCYNLQSTCYDVAHKREFYSFNGFEDLLSSSPPSSSFHSPFIGEEDNVVNGDDNDDDVNFFTVMQRTSIM